MTNPIHRSKDLRFALVAASAAMLCNCANVDNSNPDAPPVADASAGVADAPASVTDAVASEDARIGDAASVDAMPCSQSTCADGVLTVCGAAGTVDHVETCDLGCASSDRCRWIFPSNGLRAQFAVAARQEAVTLPPGTTVDADTGVVRAGNQVIAVATDTVPQSGGPAMRVFLARSWTIHDIKVRGASAVAFVAVGDVTINGVIDVSADRGLGGPGAYTCWGGTGRSQTFGFWSRRRANDSSAGAFVWNTTGAGGGGFGSPGGDGGGFDTSQPTAGPAGGVENGDSWLTPLRGGCPGGGINNGGVIIAHGGFGGGAAQVVSAGGLVVVAGAGAALAGVNAGGSGGRGCDNIGFDDPNNAPAGSGCATGGGGSGGGILIEGAGVRFEPGAALLAAGGGGGGSGACGDARHGQDAPAASTTPAGGACPSEPWGQPSVGGAGGSAGMAQAGARAAYRSAGSGGGGLGRIRINTVSGTYAGEGNVVVRGVVATGTVLRQ